MVSKLEGETLFTQERRRRLRISFFEESSLTTDFLGELTLIGNDKLDTGKCSSNRKATTT